METVLILMLKSHLFIFSKDDLQIINTHDTRKAQIISLNESVISLCQITYIYKSWIAILTY